MQNGNVKISDDVIAVIAGTAALEVEGVVLPGDGAEKRSFNRGVKVEIREGQIKVSLGISVREGANVTGVCQAAQKKVKTAIETMTGMFVAAVDVHVQGITQ